MKKKIRLKDNNVSKQTMVWSGSPLGKLLISLFAIKEDGEYTRVINQEYYLVVKEGNLIRAKLLKEVSVLDENEL